MIHVSGIIKTDAGYAVKNFAKPDADKIELGLVSFSDYETAVRCLTKKCLPKSYESYLMAVKNRKPDEDTWNNLIFIGHADGYYDHERKKFRLARELDMNAASVGELAYVEALQSTYESIQTMLKNE